jgi:hypothetical protein
MCYDPLTKLLSINLMLFEVYLLLAPEPLYLVVVIRETILGQTWDELLGLQRGLLGAFAIPSTVPAPHFDLSCVDPGGSASDSGERDLLRLVHEVDGKPARLAFGIDDGKREERRVTTSSAVRQLDADDTVVYDDIRRQREEPLAEPTISQPPAGASATM